MDDTHEFLATISSRFPSKSIVSKMLEIQDHQTMKEKSFKCIENLDCLSTCSRFRNQAVIIANGETGKQKQRLGRKRVNGFETRKYVAVSYTLRPSPHSDPTTGGYLVDPRPGSLVQCGQVSKVADSIFDRVTRYLSYVKLEIFWIDQESIDQGDERQKAAALEVIDVVYSRSKHPIALLSVPITSPKDLQLLVQIVKGDITHRSPRKTVWKAILVLKTITSDMWWTRAWTYQEDYNAGLKMTLLVPHSPLLENSKRRTQALGDLTGELCINLADFRKKATKVCRAYQAKQRGEALIIKHILEKAGKYQILHQRMGGGDEGSVRTAMSPSVVAEIGARQVQHCWDRLPITGNCCQYSVRLDTMALQRQHYSVSISLLTYFLLNGEILNNERCRHRNMLGQTIYSFLKHASFKKFDSPIPTKLTYIKSCRFTDVTLTMVGSETSGHLWKLGKVLYTKNFADELPWVADAAYGLSRHVRRRLGQLANVVEIHGCTPLAGNLRKFLIEDSKRASIGLFSKQYQDTMAEAVVDAIDKGKSLRLGRLAPPNGLKNPNSSIFIYDDNDNEDEPSASGAVYAFTSFDPERTGSDSRVSIDLDKHVSLEVEYLNSQEGTLTGQLPLLYMKKWIHGLCFFSGHRKEKVLFPYPTSLVEE